MPVSYTLGSAGTHERPRTVCGSGSSLPTGDAKLTVSVTSSAPLDPPQVAAGSMTTLAGLTVTPFAFARWTA